MPYAVPRAQEVETKTAESSRIKTASDFDNGNTSGIHQGNTSGIHQGKYKAPKAFIGFFFLLHCTTFNIILPFGLAKAGTPNFQKWPIPNV